HLLHRLLRPRPHGRAIVVARAGADVADVPHMVVEPLELECDGAYCPSPVWHLDSGDLLDRLAKPETMRDRAHAADALDDVECVQGAHTLDAFLQPAMGVEEARIQ